MEMRQLGSGTYSDCFKVKDGTGRALAAKLSYYRDSTMRAVAEHAGHGDTRAAQSARERDAVSVASGIARVAHTMREHRVSPHIVVVYTESDVSDLPPRLAPLLVPGRLGRLSARQTAVSHVCLMELCSCTLAAFVARSELATDRVMRCLIFQVLYTLACLQRLLPGFRHNDLSTNNVLLKKQDAPVTTKYVVGARTFHTENMTVAVVLADFDFTHVPGHAVLSNERVTGGRYGITDDANEGYDVHFFLKTLGKGMATRTSAPRTRAFLASVGLEGKSRPANKAPHLDPARVLHNAYFEPLLHSPNAAATATFFMPV